MNTEDDVNLPEDDSIFMDLSNRPDESTDYILEDSFSEFSHEAVASVTSTPSLSKGQNTRPAQETSRPSCSRQPDSPSSRTRSRAREASPASPAPTPHSHGSPSSRTRSRARQASPQSPAPAPHSHGSPSTRTRSRARQASPQSPAPAPDSQDSPSSRTRSRARNSTSLDSPSNRTRSRTREPPSQQVPTKRTRGRASPRTASTRNKSRSRTPEIPTANPASVPAAPSSSANRLRSRTGTSPARPGTSSAKSKIKCPKCPSTLDNKKTLDVHLRGHLMRDIVSKAPSHSELQQEMPTLINAVLIDMLLEPVIGDLSKLCHDLCMELQKNIISDATGAVPELCEFLAHEFSNILTGNRALFPSSIKSSMYVGSNKMLSSCDFVQTFKGHISCFCDSAECDEGVLNIFIGDFVMSLTKKIVIYAVRIMRGVCTAGESENRKKRSSDKIDDKEFQQLVYHIGGSVVSAFLWKGLEYSETSHTWAKFCEVLRSKFSRKRNKENQCSDQIRGHTDKTDRGGLKHCSDSAFDFFLILFDYLMSLEADSGTLPDDVIDKYVLQHDIIVCLWDELVGDDLSEVESLDLLIQITQRCVRVTMKGIMKRRINNVMKKAFSSVALRSRLAK